MLIKLLINALAFYIVAYLVPGVEIAGWQPLLILSVVWGILATIIKPIIIILTLPINIVTLGLFTFVINAALLMLAANLIKGFKIDNFLTALIASVALSIVNMFLSRLKK